MVRRPALVLVLVALAGCRIGFEARTAPDAGADAAPDAHLPLAPRFVQTDSTMNPGSPTIALAFPAEVAAGDLLLCAIDLVPATATLVSVTDDKGNAYTTAGPFDGNGGSRHYLAWTIAATGGPTTVTATTSEAPMMFYTLRLHEYADVAASSPVHGATSATGTTNATDGAQSPPIATTEPNELIFGLVTFFGPAGAAGTGFTTRSTFDADLTEDMIAATPGTYRVIATSNGSSWTATGVAVRGR